MKNKKIKLTIFVALLVGMVYYIGWTFYVSEPEYIDNCYKKVERYDYVTLPEHRYGEDGHQEVMTGIVLQVDSATATVKSKHWHTEYYDINLKQGKYRIIGKGTIYHKINDYVGFNIMLISQIFVAVLCILITYSLKSILTELLL